MRPRAVIRDLEVLAFIPLSRNHIPPPAIQLHPKFWKIAVFGVSQIKENSN